MSHSPLPYMSHPDEAICVETEKILCEFIAKTAACTAFSMPSGPMADFLSPLRSGAGFTDAVYIVASQLFFSLSIISSYFLGGKALQ